MPKDRQLIIPALSPIYLQLEPFTWPMLRAAFGLFFVPHGCQKLFGMFGGNIAGTIKFMSGVGIEPATFWAYYIGVLELAGGLLIAIGFLTRPIAALFVGFLLVGTFVAHWKFGYFWTARGFSVPLLLLVISLTILIRGGGEYSVDRAVGREF